MQTLAAAAVALTRSHPHAPALDVLDVVLGGHRGGTLDPAALYLQPGSDFGQVLAAAFDRGMSPADWRMVDNPAADPVLLAALRTVWRDVVLAEFAERFGFVVA